MVSQGFALQGVSRVLSRSFLVLCNTSFWVFQGLCTSLNSSSRVQGLGVRVSGGYPQPVRFRLGAQARKHYANDYGPYIKGTSRFARALYTMRQQLILEVSRGMLHRVWAFPMSYKVLFNIYIVAVKVLNLRFQKSRASFRSQVSLRGLELSLGLEV